METTISFPGLGIEEFTVDRAAFSVFGKEIYWYGIIIMMGMIVAFVYAYLRTKQEGIKSDDILDVGLWTIPVGVIGARLFYVIFDYIERPWRYKTFLDFIAIWEGGLAIYGGVIAGALIIWAVTRHKKINTLKVMDCIAPGVMIAQAIGRWGNFINGEAHGGVVAETSPLYFLRMGLYEEGRMQYFHPTFLYESVWNLVGFILITCLYRKKKFNGQITLAYLTWYGFGRMFIEGLRTDSLWVIPDVIRVSQVIGGACFVVGGALMIAGLIFVKKGIWGSWLNVTWAEPALADGETAETAEAAETAEDYTPVFTATAEESDETIDESADGAPDTSPENTDTPKE